MKRLYYCNAYMEECTNVVLKKANGATVGISHAIRLQSYNSTACYFSTVTQKTYVCKGIWDCSMTTHQHMRKFHEWLHSQGYVCAMPYSAALVRASIKSGDGDFIEYVSVYKEC